MITTIIFILFWFFTNILVLRFFYVSNPPQKVRTVYVGLSREEWKVIAECIDQQKMRGLSREITDQVRDYTSFEPK